MPDATQAALEALVEIAEDSDRDPDVRIRAAGTILNWSQSPAAREVVPA
jgi:hypothetical protein